MNHKEYIETFDDGPGGWLCWPRAGTPTRPEIHSSAIVTRGPWFVDSNHASPGAGYLHLMFVLHTHLDHPAFPPGYKRKMFRVSGPNRFMSGRFSRDFRNAEMTVRIRGKMNLRGARLVLLAQADISRGKGRVNWVNQVLSSQPLTITPRWSEQTLRLTTDHKKWTPLGAREPGFYGDGPIEEVLRDLNGDLIFVLFPLEVVLRRPLDGAPHSLKEMVYEVDSSRLPDGRLEMDEVRIKFP